MSKLDGMLLKDAMPIIIDLYESFSLKSMILFNDDEWINLVTVINLTRRTVEDLNNEYRSLEKSLVKMDYDNFKIIFQARPISEINDVISEIQKGHIKIGEFLTKLLSSDSKRFVDEKIRNSSHVLRGGEYAEYNCYEVILTMGDSPSNLLKWNGISPSMLGVQNFRDLARSWLGIDNIDASINILLVIPIYATLTGFQYQGGNEINATLKLHEKLLDESKVWIIRKRDDDYAPILERSQYDLASCEHLTQNGFIYTSIRHDFSALGSNDIIYMSVMNHDLGQIARQSMRMRDYPPKSSDPFLQMFDLFDAGIKVEEHLLNPIKPDDFVAAFSWLLEMIDIRSLRLGKDEIVRENETQKGSADIIAYDSDSNNLLAIDCTIGVPNGSKIDKIKNTADYISRIIQFPVKAVIVTSEKTPFQKSAAKKQNVKILDNIDLEELIGHFKKDIHFRPRARNIILSF